VPAPHVVKRRRKKKKRKKPVSAAKARTILRHGSVHGKKLSPRQKRFFGLIAGGGTPKRG
jgi:hypothetical protein